MSSEPALTRDDLQPWETPDETEVFGGDLQDVSLNSLVQLSQAESISGWTRIHGRGEVRLARGRITGAACGALRGVEALRELMFLREGRYVALHRALALRPGDRVVQQNLKALARRRASARGVHS